MSKRRVKRFIFLLLMFIFSPLLLVSISLIVILEIIICPFELLIYKKKYAFLGTYYPLSWYFNRIIIKIDKFLLTNNYNYTYDKLNKVFFVNDKIIYFKISDIKNIRNIYGQNGNYRFIRINTKENIIQLRKEL